jgi:hypothetical protein
MVWMRISTGSPLLFLWGTPYFLSKNRAILLTLVLNVFNKELETKGSLNLRHGLFDLITESSFKEISHPLFHLLHKSFVGLSPLQYL